MSSGVKYGFFNRDGPAAQWADKRASVNAFHFSGIIGKSHGIFIKLDAGRVLNGPLALCIFPGGKTLDLLPRDCVRSPFIAARSRSGLSFDLRLRRRGGFRVVMRVTLHLLSYEIAPLMHGVAVFIYLAVF